MLAAAILALAAGTGEAATALPPDLAAYAATAATWLLEGESLPPDYRVQLMRMPPAHRLQAIVFLRRAGLLRADPWTLEDILKPAADPHGDRE
ncbi:hypothetical protein JHW45_02045 [Paracoccus stylophorae]|uniref:Uncharacterized protein n=1 Tax=Paracoccus stylophorae TaxID=659350 RepID=A0ABY7SZ45_9RHOB|nr:hypothetical protein [Paracoccus stylophorae]WCR11212.1 hypothetical protein JHW45_02045 [Paracoccus stylophorae]